MNPDGFKSELQQVLDNDLSLRKEFNELKRSLSDYRNQLIMRDEDCKRLQVTIDVLNTKLTVMERDNNSYKAELTSFRELREGIDAQLQEKQKELDERISEIQQLREEITSLSAAYDQASESIRVTHEAEVRRLTVNHENEISELRTNTQYREAGIRDEYENRLSSMSSDWSEKEQMLHLRHEEVINTLEKSHEMAISIMQEQHAIEVLTISGELNAVKNSREEAIRELENRFEAELKSARESHIEEISALKLQAELQRDTLTSQFEANIGALSADFDAREAAIRNAYDGQISVLNDQLASQAAHMGANFESRVNAMSASHDEILSKTTTEYESRIAELINDYEAKLSNTLIHSTSQNSRLNEELERSRTDGERGSELINDLRAQLEAKEADMASGAVRIGELEAMLRNEADRLLSLETEFNAFREHAALSTDEKVTELNSQIVTLNQNHSEYVAELCTRIDDLNNEVRNLGILFETTSNQLSEAENNAERLQAELRMAAEENGNLKLQLETGLTETERFRNELRAGADEAIKATELEYNKLLAENTNLIIEIDRAQDKIEAQDAELDLLRTELQELKMVSAGKTQDFKEILSTKNFELTSLEANNAALKTELELQKEASARLQENLSSAEAELAAMAALREVNTQLLAERNTLESELTELQSAVIILNQTIQSLNNQLNEKEAALEALRRSSESNVNALAGNLEDHLHRIQVLNDEKLSLLDEKEQMATQLLKMNEVIGNLSQHVESERIDVTSLNNHRKNVILAGNSSENADNSEMKKQINELVREIDKCIALLSA
jgi:chromosome segregation ATPase